MSLTYNTFTTSLANMIVVPVNDPNYVTALPNIIDDAEQRLYRELDLLSTVTLDDSGSMTTGIRQYSLPTFQGRFVVTNSISALLNANTNLSPMDPVSLDYMFAVWPGEAGAGLPNCYAMITDQIFIVGPAPDQPYGFRVVGTIRPTPLSASNPTTFLSLYLPDVFLAAALVMSAGYQLNFSAAGDNPQAGVTWETHVKTLLASAKTEELRKRYGSEGWTSKGPNPLATPPQT